MTDDPIDDAINAYHRAAVAKHEATERRMASGGLARETDPEQRALGAARTAIDRAITAHVEAEVARRLAAAPEVEESIAQIVVCTDLMDNAGSARARDNLRAAIAADKARAVCASTAHMRPMVSREQAAQLVDKLSKAMRRVYDEGEWRAADGPAAEVIDALTGGEDAPARPTPDEARRLVDDAMQAAWGLNRPSGQSPDRRDAARERATAARTALLRALGVEA